VGDFSEFYRELNALVAKSGEIQLKVEADLDSDIVKIFGGRFTSLSRARNGLDDMAELSLTAAEHHPYWDLLSQCCQICSSVLGKWDGELTAEDLDEIRWSLRELDNACKKLEEKVRQR